MGGADKGLLPYRGRPLITHVIDRLAPQVFVLLISANRNLDAYLTLGHAVIADNFSDFPGPLAGLAAGLATCTTDWLVTCPCDCPALPGDLVVKLLSAAEQRNVSLALAVTPDRLQPTFQLCHRSLLPVLTTYLAAGNRKVADWCRQQGAIEVPFPDPAPFRNLNTPADLT